MKNIVCPISPDRVPEHLPRVTALIVVGLLLAYLATGFSLLLIFLFIDFIARGTDNAKYSPINYVARFVSKTLRLKSGLIDKAPKLFAARMGFVMIGAAIIFHAIGLTGVASILALGVAFFATLECVANFCVGCYIYSFLVLPLYQKK